MYMKFMLANLSVVVFDINESKGTSDYINELMCAALVIAAVVQDRTIHSRPKIFTWQESRVGTFAMEAVNSRPRAEAYRNARREAASSDGGAGKGRFKPSKFFGNTAKPAPSIKSETTGQASKHEDRVRLLFTKLKATTLTGHHPPPPNPETRNYWQSAKIARGQQPNLLLVTNPANLSPSRATTHPRPLDPPSNPETRSNGKDSRVDNIIPLVTDKLTSKTVSNSCVASPSPSPLPTRQQHPHNRLTALSASTAVGEREENEIPEDLRVADHGLSNTPVIQSRITMGRQRLAAQSTQLESAYLLIHGALPSRDRYKTWVREVIHHSVVYSDAEDFFRSFRYDAHPKVIPTSAFAYLGTYYADANSSLRGRMSPPMAPPPPCTHVQKIFRLTGKATTLAATTYCVRHGRDFVVPPTGAGELQAVPGAGEAVGRAARGPRAECVPDDGVAEGELFGGSVFGSSATPATEGIQISRHYEGAKLTHASRATPNPAPRNARCPARTPPAVSSGGLVRREGTFEAVITRSKRTVMGLREPKEDVDERPCLLPGRR
ncbi:hypothetical protein FIBSPDRAFT_929444 [Athelia psychrophila]|uniref:Uncharacterized protein n=1 Tax=Athelia psychrophila TaxID=1759441 RepID=A0A166NMS3_9AGAM|nr:hypothetical protein FIBSPDRAFT_929444 [Fibularhizoctonia sp. CBS 109695]